MKVLLRILGITGNNDGTEPIKRFVILLLAFAAFWLYTFFTIFYHVMGIETLAFFMGTQALLCFFMYICSYSGGAFSQKITFLLLSISVCLLHFSMTYFFGNCGTVFLLLAVILPNHLFSFLPGKAAVAVDIVAIIWFNIVFRIELSFEPAYLEGPPDVLRFAVMNISLAICLLELLLSFVGRAVMEKGRMQQVQKAKSEALVDVLTQLGNRRMFDHKEEMLVSSAEAGEPLSVALLDIDYFKRINDTYGHAAGDMVLRFLANKMKSSFRRSDVLLRWGGEEFLLLMKDTDVSDAEDMVERFRYELRVSPVSLEGEQVFITVTAGLCQHKPGAQLKETIEKADALMYRGKLAGRDRTVREE